MASEDDDLKNGSNLIVIDEHGKILVVKEKTRKQLWMLPGGEIERGESADHAAQSETEEETGIWTDAATFELVAYFVQRPKGYVFLYQTRQYRGEIVVPDNSAEVSEARFMDFDEIIAMGEAGFRTAYLRMILRWKRCQLGIDRAPFSGRLSDVVEFPRNFKGLYSDSVLSV